MNYEVLIFCHLDPSAGGERSKNIINAFNIAYRFFVAIFANKMTKSKKIAFRNSRKLIKLLRNKGYESNTYKRCAKPRKCR